MITGRVLRDDGRASISFFNSYGEVDTAGWRQDDFTWAGQVADHFGLLLVDVRDHLTDTSIAHGFVMSSDSVHREPRLLEAGRAC